MALGYLQRENLILESYWLVHKEKACVASRKHLKRRSKGKFWKINSGFYKISCKPPLEMRILPRDTTFYKAALQWQILTCSKEIKRAYSCKSSGYICISIYILASSTLCSLQKQTQNSDFQIQMRNWPIRSGFRFRIKQFSFIVPRGWKWLESHGIHGSFIWWNLLQN